MSVFHPTGVLRKPRLWLSRFQTDRSYAFFFHPVRNSWNCVGRWILFDFDQCNAAIETKPETVWTLLSFNIFIIGGLLLVLGAQALRVRRRQRAGLAGARLHGRMITLFSTIAVLPAILVAVLPL